MLRSSRRGYCFPSLRHSPLSSRYVRDGLDAAANRAVTPRFPVAARALTHMTSTIGGPAPTVSVVHTAVRGRARLRVGGLRHSGKLKAALERGLLGRNGIRSVSANIWTGNVLIFYDPGEDLAPLLASISEDIRGGLPPSAAAEPVDTIPAASRVTVSGGAFSFFRDLLEWLRVAGRQARTGLPSARRPAVTVAPRALPESLARPWHTLDVRHVAQFWETSLSDGLPSAVARRRLAEYGPNSLPSYKGRSPPKGS